MADYRYLGLTAYIKGVDHKEVGVLIEAIDALQGCDEIKDFDINDYPHVTRLDAFDQVQVHDYLCYADDSELPVNTPDRYKKPIIEPFIVSGAVFTRIYIPAVSKNKDRLDDFVHQALRPVIESLFGDKLICLKTKAGIEYEDFQDGKETLLISVKDSVPQIA